MNYWFQMAWCWVVIDYINCVINQSIHPLSKSYKTLLSSQWSCDSWQFHNNTSPTPPLGRHALLRHLVMVFYHSLKLCCLLSLSSVAGVLSFVICWFLLSIFCWFVYLFLLSSWCDLPLMCSVADCFCYTCITYVNYMYVKSRGY